MSLNEAEILLQINNKHQRDKAFSGIVRLYPVSYTHLDVYKRQDEVLSELLNI